MSQSELLKRSINALNAAGSPYMLTGSTVSSLQGEPRSTHDIDLQVLNSKGVQALLAEFPPPDFYLDAIAAADAIARKGQFNLLDIINGDKVHFWMLTDDPFDQSRFARRIQTRLDDISLYVSRPEDTILMKLRWADLSGGSEKQVQDAIGIFQLQAGTLGLDYIEQWASRLEVVALWERVRSA